MGQPSVKMILKHQDINVSPDVNLTQPQQEISDFLLCLLMRDSLKIRRERDPTPPLIYQPYQN